MIMYRGFQKLYAQLACGKLRAFSPHPDGRHPEDFPNDFDHNRAHFILPQDDFGTAANYQNRKTL